MILPRDESVSTGSATTTGSVSVQKPRAGPEMQFVDPSSQVNWGIWTLFVGATAFLALRIWSKMHRRHGLWWDDHILVSSWAVLLATNIFITIELATGYVSETWDDRMLILVSISSCLITVGQTLSKTAFAVTLLRITESWQRFALWVIIVSLNLYLAILLILNWVNYCDQDVYWWKIPVVCAPYDIIFQIKIGQNVFNIIIDFVLSLFPWLVTWKLRIERYEKIGLCVAMSLGTIIAIFTSVRTWVMLDPNLNAYDSWYVWRQGHIEIWYQAEVAGTIIVQTLPVIRLIIQDLQMSLMSTKLNETAGRIPTIGTGTNKTARNSRAWAAANNPHSLSDVTAGDPGATRRGCTASAYDKDGGEAGIVGKTSTVEHFELHDLEKLGTVDTREQRESRSTFSNGDDRPVNIGTAI
ncbi:hypothetical protein DHEL01_v206696 [Diaporthe helianthi]|uniref:Rhodopsin domain-containing protein n=1 Tax=Diaporthe helianthi TaxID=158607 RepID=A0A2P5HXD1_DIAHE|nr:hypothetical protein DHEL01_v206696 [Diaporthe helianthi]